MNADVPQLYVCVGSVRVCKILNVKYVVQTPTIKTTRPKRNQSTGDQLYLSDYRAIAVLERKSSGRSRSDAGGRLL